MAHPIVRYGSLIVSVIPGLIGVQTLLQPEAVLTKAGFFVPEKARDKQLACSLLRFHGLRNVIVSGLLATIWSAGDDNLMSAGLCGALAMCVGDGFIARSLMGEGAWNHWGIAPVLVGLIGGLQGWWSKGLGL